MKIGDLVTMDTPLTPERYGVGIIQKVVSAGQFPADNKPRLHYHIHWSDEATSIQYDNEIVLISEV